MRIEDTIMIDDLLSWPPNDKIAFLQAKMLASAVCFLCLCSCKNRYFISFINTPAVAFQNK